MPQCTGCTQPFTITDRDKAFYQKMNVPDPALCFECRRQHLLCWRNQRTLYNRTCDVTGKPVISVFAPGSPYKVVDRDYWWSDKWDPLEYAQEFDFSKTFAEQFDELMHRVPMACIFNTKEVNSAYCQHGGEMKNCYLVNASWLVEDSLYGEQILKSRNCVDNLAIQECEQCYELVGCTACYNTTFSLYAERCIDSSFLFACSNCSNCIGCTNLRKKSYHIFNKPYSKEAYAEMVASLKLNTREGLAAMQNKFYELKKQAVHRCATLINCEDSTGDHLVNVKRSSMCFDARDIQDSAYCMNAIGPMRDVYNGYGVGDSLERGYFLFDSGVKGTEQMFCGTVYGCSFTYYSYNCHSAFEIFGCTGLRNKKYCILNKEYSKEEYLALKEKIIAHMRHTGEWGEFFPPRVAPFGYNESLAFDYVPMTKEEALGKGFKWQDRVPGTFGKETALLEALGNLMNGVSEEVTKEIFACEDCKKNFKIIKQEFAFHKKIDAPLPHKCPDCRFRVRLAARNPHRLWQRQCMCKESAHNHAERCPHEFETVFAPERPETVYCNECYVKDFV